MMTLVVLLAGVLATLANTSGSSTFQAEFHQTYALGAQGRLTLENIQGDVQVTAWDRDDVQVDAVRRADSRELLEATEIVVDKAPGSIAIKSLYPAADSPGHPASVDYTVMVPRAARLDQIKLVNGTLEITGVKGEVRASSVDGAIRTRNLAGDVRLATVSGRLEAIFDELDSTKSIFVNSVNGPIEVLLPMDAHAQLRADTVSGGIRNDFGRPMERGHSLGRHLNTALKGGGTRIRVSNVNGSISLAPVWHGKRVKFT